MRRALFVLPGLLVLALGATLVAWAQGTTSQADVAKLIAQDAKYLQDTLAKPALDKKAQRKVRAAALMIAQYAQSGIGKDNPKSAALAAARDKAIDLLKAVDGDKLAEAKKLAAELSGEVKGTGKTDPVALNKLIDFETVMRQFSGERVGGFGLEKVLDDLAGLKADLDAAESEKIQLFSHKVGQIGALAESNTPEKDDGKKTKTAWVEFAKEMQSASRELAEAAKGKQAAAIAKATEKLTGSCTRCHDIFR